MSGGNESFGGGELLDVVVCLGHGQHHLEDALLADLAGAQLGTAVEEGGDGNDGPHASFGVRP